MALEDEQEKEENIKTVPLEPLQLKTARGQKFALIVMYVCSHCSSVCM